MRLNVFPAVAAVTGFPAAETKNVRRAAKRCRVARSQAANTSTTWPVTGSLRLRRPLDATTSMWARRRSTCSLGRARASPVLIPHECISVKNATACHRHGDAASNLAAAAKNASISPRASR